MHMLAVLSLLVAAVSAYPTYRDKIPNGYSVPDPCGGGIWEAVGHYDPTHHTILKNMFGQHFAAEGHMWTPKLCGMDSDGDGILNGVELGDPNCIWTVGAIPAGPATGHPGICNPVSACGGFTCGCHGNQCVGK
ncbi:temptin-like [Mya arenaria]|uniref:temptin-like n=1 Tax=Mya arenaria TaxID=6604 RepID=UPI0022E01F3E|nr:temptin-like [Mya arenaria]